MGACSSNTKWDEIPTGSWPQKSEGVVVRMSFHHDASKQPTPFSECVAYKVHANAGTNKLDIVRSDYMVLSDHKLVPWAPFMNTVASIPFAVSTGIGGFALEEFTPTQLESLKSIDVSTDFWKVLSVGDDDAYRVPQLKAQSIAFAEDEWSAWVFQHSRTLEEIGAAMKKAKEPENIVYNKKTEKVQGEMLMRLEATKTTKALSTDEFTKRRDLTLSSGLPFRHQYLDHDVTLRTSGLHSFTGFRPFHARVETVASRSHSPTVFDAREYVFLWTEFQGKTATGPNGITYPDKFELKAEGMATFVEAHYKHFLKTVSKSCEKTFEGTHALSVDIDALGAGVSPVKQSTCYKLHTESKEEKQDKDDAALRLSQFLNEVGIVTTAEEFRDNQLVNIAVSQTINPAARTLELAAEEERDLYNLQSPVHHTIPPRLTITADQRVRSGSSKSTTPTHSMVAAAAAGHAPHVSDVFGAPGASAGASCGSRPPSAPSSGRARGPSAFTFDAAAQAAAPPEKAGAIESVMEAAEPADDAALAAVASSGRVTKGSDAEVV